MADDPPEIDPPQSPPPALREELIEELRPFVRPGEEERAATVIEAVAIRHSGPLPPAREMGHYEMVLPGLANRIVTMAEQEQTHRHSLERKIVFSQIGIRRLGQILAAIALLAILVVVALIAHWGHPVQAAWLGSVVIVGVVALFLGQRPPWQRGKGSEEESDEPAEDDEQDQA